VVLKSIAKGPNQNFALSNIAVMYAQEEFEHELPPGLEDALGRDLEL